MKAIMRLDKSQVKPQVLYESSSPATYFKKAVYMMAGYKNYEALLVGAAGGYSGDATDGSSTYRTYRAGGGGGGILKLQGTLESLQDETQVGVGVAGTDGTNSFVEDVQAGNGTDGGQSMLIINSIVYAAHGGKGGIGARYHITTSQNLNINAEGGDGGGNSAGLGTGGVGGVCAEEDTAYSFDVRDAVPATDGTYVVGGVLPVVGGGVGGGGGAGRVKEINPADGSPDPWPGKTGSAGSGYAVAGAPASTNYGGPGGGGKVDTLLDWYSPSGLTSGKMYGSRPLAADPFRIANGCVAIVIS